MEMERIDRIMAHPGYRRLLAEIGDVEKDRIFCKHGVEHLLDVARIAWIMNLEEGAALEKETVYAAAFLHDIGKAKQYLDGTPHQITSSEYAEEILADCGFDEDERKDIREAILSHRDGSVKMERNLRGLLYRADKASRACFGCAVSEECNWSPEKKNLNVKY